MDRGTSIKAAAVATVFLLQICLLSSVVSASSDISINAANFPDETFRQYVSTYIDRNNDSFLSQEEIDAVTLIDVSGTSSTPGTAADLTGIGYFTRLEGLYCSENQLTSLDISRNTALTELKCSNNKLTSLDVSNNKALIGLDCCSNKLTGLDLSNNKALTELVVYDNQLISLDLSKNTALCRLICDNNRLTSLDVSKNIALCRLFCGGNQLRGLDVSNNTALEELSCYSDQLPSLDVSKNTMLNSLDCSENQIKSLDVSNNNVLEKLWCGSNQLKSLDLSNNTSLISLSCPFNKLTSLDVSNNTALIYLSCSKNQLTSLDVSQNTALTNLYCSVNIFPIVPKNGSFFLSGLPADFDPDKASEWTGAAYDAATNSLNNFTSETVTYKYDCGNNRTATFTLKCTFVEIGNITVNSDSVAITYSDDSSETYSFDEVPKAVVDFMINNDMESCAAFVNAFSADKDTMILTYAQLKAVEAVLASDFYKYTDICH